MQYETEEKKTGTIKIYKSKRIGAELKHSSIICCCKEKQTLFTPNQTCMKLLNFQRLEFDKYGKINMRLI